MYYNFARPHMSLANPYPQTPAMAAGVSDHVWKIEEIVALPNEHQSTWRQLWLGVACALIAYGAIFGALGAVVTVIVALSGNLPSGAGPVFGLAVFAVLAVPAFLLARRFDRELRADSSPQTDPLPRDPWSRPTSRTDSRVGSWQLKFGARVVMRQCLVERV